MISTGDLKAEIENGPEVFSFSERPKLAAQVASLGMLREIGSVNDEIARFVFDAFTGHVVPRESLRAELVHVNGFDGIRIFSNQTNQLELRARGVSDLIHPTRSYSKGSLTQLVIFPEIVEQTAALNGIELVVVREWALNSVFGRFDPQAAYYQTNFWELENNDTLQFADLIRKGRLAFLGTHDFVAHIANLNREAWELLKNQAEKVSQALRNYLSDTKRPSISSLVLPYTIGVVLDDLAQPPSYGSISHGKVLDALLEELADQRIASSAPRVLQKFPSEFQRTIELARTKEISREQARAQAKKLAAEIAAASTISPAYVSSTSDCVSGSGGKMRRN